MNQPIIPKPKRISKKQMITDHLLSGRPLTQWECIHLYRHTRLGAVVHELRRQGYVIHTINQRNSNDDGTHAKYVLGGAV